MAKVIIVGAGTVGQANGIGLMTKGHEVVFLDIDPNVVEKLRSITFSAYLVNQFYDNSVSDKFESDITVFCVPTPFITRNEKPIRDNPGNSTDNCGSIDLSYILTSVSNHAKWLGSRRKRIERNGGRLSQTRCHNYTHLVVIRSTVPPGTTRNLLLPLIQSNSGMKVGKEIGLCMQPEFLRTSSSLKDFLNPRASVIGEFDKISGDILEYLYADFGGRIFRTDIETAEFMKYVQNSFNATKISFSNEMWMLGEKLGLDANSALKMTSILGEGFWNPTYGVTGGQPYDGACLPKDVKSFLNFANEQGLNMPLLSAVDAVNSYMNRAQKRLRKRRDPEGLNKTTQPIEQTNESPVKKLK